MNKFHAVKLLVELFNIPYAKARQVLVDNNWDVLEAVQQLRDDKVKDAVRKRMKELEEENARLRQQRDSANAMLDAILEQKAP